MISEIYLKHFKCFEELRLPLAPLTVLTGWNSSGKSTVIQALVLLDQTMSEMATSRRLKLNGRQVNLGTFADISNRTSGRGSGEIRLKILDALYSWTFIRDEKTPHLPLVKAVSILTPALNTMNTDDGKLYRLLPEAENFDGDRKKMAGLTYLSADRIAARETYAGFRDTYDDSDIDKPTVGPRGEFALALLSEQHSELVHSALTIDAKATGTVLGQTEAWLTKIFRDAGIDLRKMEGTNLVSMGVRSSSLTGFLRPQNVGYGLTQALPIVIMGLCAKPGQTLLIENPEVHLHPFAQSAIGAFLAKVASTGVQVIFESHSDHVINGMRRAIKEKVIPFNEASVYFFGGEKIGDVEHIQINQDGKLSAWPPGFFDQNEEDLAFITGM